jgi:hypothetical protein
MLSHPYLESDVMERNQVLLDSWKGDVARMEVEGSEEYVWRTGLLSWKKPGVATKGFPSQ